MVSQATQRQPLTLAGVDPDDDHEMDRLEERELGRAAQRIGRAVEELLLAGILDKNGDLIPKELPPDMRTGSTTDV